MNSPEAFAVKCISRYITAKAADCRLVSVRLPTPSSVPNHHRLLAHHRIAIVVTKMVQGTFCALARMRLVAKLKPFVQQYFFAHFHKRLIPFQQSLQYPAVPFQFTVDLPDRTIQFTV